MKQYHANNIKNIALAGHAGSGKTSLAEAMLFTAGASDRLGKVIDSNTVLDFDAEEKKRHTSVSTAFAPLEWKDVKVNLVDTPGLFDFAGGVCEGLRAVDGVLTVISGKSGVTVGAEKAYKAAKKAGKGTMFFINKLDSDKADFHKCMDSLIAKFGKSVCPIVVPIIKDHHVEALVNLLTAKRYTYDNGKITETDTDLSGFEKWVGELNEAIASASDELMEKFFAGEPFTREEQIIGISTGLLAGEISPVFCGAGRSLIGIDRILDGIINYMPTAARGKAEESAEGEEIACDENAPLSAVAFKTIADPFVGKLTYFKVQSGVLKPDSQVMNARTGETERIGKVLMVRGGKQEEVSALYAGDLGAVAKLATVMTGDTICATDHKITLPGVDYPAPCLNMAIRPKKKGEEEKVVSGLRRLIEEDPTISQVNNTETMEQIVSGLGEQHLDVVVSKLKNKFGVEVELASPRVAYRETIRKKVSVQGRHKKQSGGHGQFGDVWIEFEPIAGEGFEFAERVVGGSVPKNYFPAVEKGLNECIRKGVLAGYPVVGLRATLYDGSYHPVDSSEMAFKTAASIAFKNGIPDASPAILEPIGTLVTLVPEELTGDIIGELNKRRGRVLGMNPAEDHQQEVTAEVPMAEMADFSTLLRQLSQGRGTFTLNFERYEEAPTPVAMKVIAEARAAGDVE